MNRTCPKWFCPIDALSGNAPTSFFLTVTSGMLMKYGSEEKRISFMLACFCHLTHLCHSSSLCCYNVRESHVLKQYSIFIPKLMHTVNFVIIIQESIFERSERLEKLHQVCCSLIHHKLALFPPDVKDKDHRDHWYLFIIHKQLLDNNKHVGVVDQFLKFFEFFCLRNLVYEASFFFLQRSAFVFNHESMTSCKTSSKLFYSLAFSFSFEFAILISVKRMVKLLLLLHSGSQGGEWGAEVKLKNSSLVFFNSSENNITPSSASASSLLAFPDKSYIHLEEWTTGVVSFHLVDLLAIKLSFVFGLCVAGCERL
ncbi:hypothetical protein T02_12284 [Trichinella nativa]|uniref:Uncharacterized protein n=1 Tax=Trichinella nativa TaxID=6335 RepID=A0A0V1LTC9_9BILA|nr:hypothetical protein T02_12284 [Trichinella nativa]